MITIYVKPAPSLDPTAVKVLKSDTGVGLLDAAGNVPEGGMPWPNGGLTLILLRDGAILRADDPAFEVAADVAEANDQIPSPPILKPETGPITASAPAVPVPAATPILVPPPAAANTEPAN